ncbi:DNA mismatch endonuclease Vsr [Commensalibacter sp. M0270]|nr:MULTISPECIES: very short patch repair endonuclease [unclassified Commensalibacter]MBH9969953.1 DNA mismatch endonuclease Vsr [Commensalibacter sp. M0265]MBH9977151.1 DNA mismatch endonuclease Vsr [Commensalibacter sp. M0266]MBH9992988.1 DNA mismatch endonuclease Vsr [Commensalibacter sp. M0270]MBI0046327.1 DNA mismatch endonuclease Vsr [Commensalibacter sp. M0267]MBI0056153.1 DNA mismatch endonuclease Vsr [Commensalibacter sp. M0268]
MIDIVDQKTRSRLMSCIRCKNTAPEMFIRRILHSRGYRYRLHDHKLPGKPDMVFRKYNAVIFIHGCFWHGHDCHLFRMPSSRVEFWKNKIETNKKRDMNAICNLRELGWRSMIIWECAIKGKKKVSVEDLVSITDYWFRKCNDNMQVRGK